MADRHLLYGFLGIGALASLAIGGTVYYAGEAQRQAQRANQADANAQAATKQVETLQAMQAKVDGVTLQVRGIADTVTKGNETLTKQLQDAEDARRHEPPPAPLPGCRMPRNYVR